MLDLNSSRWGELKHAYGRADGDPDTREVLRQLYTVSNNAALPNELSEELWSSICHQGTVYTASYAALPHIVEITKERLPEHRLVHIILITSIQQGRHRGDSAPIPTFLADSYFSALKQTTSLITDCLSIEWTEEEYRYLLSALAAMQGHIALAWQLERTEDTETCPECQAVFATQGYEQFVDKEKLSSGTKLFFGEHSAGDFNDYLKWCVTHPAGFVIVNPLDGPISERELHRVGCTELNRIDYNEPRHFHERVWRLCSTDWWSMYNQICNLGLSPWQQTINRCQVCISTEPSYSD